VDENEDRGKYMLLNRLFKLVQTKEELNDVLCGYFEKLVMSLRKRKEQQFIKYIFGDGAENLDHLMHHVYQTSIAVLVKELLGIQAANYEVDF